MKIHPYNRAAAVDYAHKWALGRNPEYADFETMGGDCSNFISQCLYAGSGVMNETPGTGWYYHSLKNRAPGWSGVPFLFRFLTANQGNGPFGHAAPLDRLELGDVIQLKFAGKDDFSHSLLVVSHGAVPGASNILIAAHSYDCDNRPLNSYSFVESRAVHIDGVRA